jgi:hypothetical protein
MKRTFSVLFVFFLCCPGWGQGQLRDYDYQRELKGISGEWHHIPLPNELFQRVDKDLADIRIFGITSTSDTLQAPYVLQAAHGRSIPVEAVFQLRNTSYNAQGHFFTFEVPDTMPINQIKLEFEQRNFDWQVQLEGSQDQAEWFTLLEDYRILAIYNQATDFQFTTLQFPSASYRYYRLRVAGGEAPKMLRAHLERQEDSQGTFREYDLKKWEVSEQRQTQQTEIYVELLMPVPISEITVGVKDAYSYYRPVTLQYVTDSVATDKGWKYSYAHLASGILRSGEKAPLYCDPTIVKKLKLVVHNQDNQPLSISALRIRGAEHALMARFTESASYVLAYGNKGARKPSYDLGRFLNEVPADATSLSLGKEVAIKSTRPQPTPPLFGNSLWLWAVLVAVMAVLGWFTLGMIKKNNAAP